MNRNPAWKYLLLLIIVAFGVIYAMPNLYQSEPGIQVIGVRNAPVDQNTVGQVTRALEANNIEVKSIVLEGDKVRASLFNDEDQVKAKELLKASLGADYPVALADIPTTPSWLQDLGGAQCSLAWIYAAVCIF